MKVEADGIIANYPGIPITIQEDGDVIFHCEDLKQAKQLLESIPKVQLKQKEYKCENCGKSFTAKRQYRQDEYECEEWFVICPFCKEENWLQSYCWYR